MAVGVVTGYEEIDRKLRQIEPKFQKRVVRKAMRAGAKIILPIAKQKAPKLSGNLSKAIKISTPKKIGKWIGLNVGVGKQWFVGDEFYGAFQEFGTKKMKPHAYVEPTYEEQKDKVLKFVLGEMEVGLMNIIGE